MAAETRLEVLKRDLDTAKLPPARATQSAAEIERGRAASDPWKIPAAGWKDVMVRSWAEVGANNIFLAAGGVTYAGLVALFPALAALVSIYGLILDPAQVERQVRAMSSFLPEESTQIISDELHSLISHSSSSLGISVGISLLIALWSASRGTSGLINALNIAYRQTETRGYIKLNLVAIGLTLAMIACGITAIALVGILPAAIQFLGLGALAKWGLLILEWPLLIAMVLGSLATLYHFAPSREKPQWRWVSPGAVAATLLWLLGSLAFTIYVAHFNSYGKTYGSLGGVVILLTWLWLTSFTALFGAVINAEVERQTTKDTTEPGGKPMGSRGAFAADTLGGKAR
jgi:membrane protein